MARAKLALRLVKHFAADTEFRCATMLLDERKTRSRPWPLL